MIKKNKPGDPPKPASSNAQMEGGTLGTFTFDATTGTGGQTDSGNLNSPMKNNKIKNGLFSKWKEKRTLKKETRNVARESKNNVGFAESIMTSLGNLTKKHGENKSNIMNTAAAAGVSEAAAEGLAPLGNMNPPSIAAMVATNFPSHESVHSSKSKPVGLPKTISQKKGL